MRNSVSLFSSLLLGLFLASCGGGDSFDCPSCHDEVRSNGYGRFIFGQAGYDSAAREIVDNCEFRIYNGHNGGSGDTLQIAGCYVGDKPGVIFEWAYNSFRRYAVCNPGYKGDSPQLKPGECYNAG